MKNKTSWSNTNEISLSRLAFVIRRPFLSGGKSLTVAVDRATDDQSSDGDDENANRLQMKGKRTCSPIIAALLSALPDAGALEQQ
uniref:Uncharacterized protein n=1 Tax=Romanomermis culicivorax TaxID=13658 RepID=A0A915IX93_ROMCU